MPDLYSAFGGKRVLITGGLGFIGSNLARRLLDFDARVLLVDALIPTHGGNPYNVAGIEDRVTINVADIRDKTSMDYLVQGQDYIFNLAGQVSHIDSMRDPYTDLEINCVAQLSLLESCRAYNPEVKIVYASTRQIYGIPRYLPVDEDHICWPTDVNGINTLAGEQYHLLYSNVHGIWATALRLTNTYGPRMFVKNDRHDFIGWFLRKALDGEEILIFGDGRQERDITYVDDAVEAFLLAAACDEANGQAFNLGGTEHVSLLDFTRTLVEVAGSGSYRLAPFPEERKRIDIGSYHANYERVRRTMGWEPRISLRDGLERTVAFFRVHRDHYWQ